MSLDLNFEGRHGLLSLTVERWILDECVDRDPYIFLIRDLVCDAVGATTAFDREYRVSKETRWTVPPDTTKPIADASVDDGLLCLCRAVQVLRRYLCTTN